MNFLKLGISVGMLSMAVHASAELAVPGEYIVKFKNAAAMKSFHQKFKAVAVNEIKVDFGTYALVKNLNVSKTITAIAQDENVEYIEPNFTYHLLGAPEKLSETIKLLQGNYEPTDAQFGKLWGLKNTGSNDPTGNFSGAPGADIDATRAWDVSRGSKTIKIAVIDTGIDYNHQDLKANMWVNEAEANGIAGVDDDMNGVIDDIHGARFTSGVVSGNPMDGNSHGTHCAGTIGAIHDANGVAGVMNDVQFVAVKFLSDSGSGSTADAISAINYATKLGVDVMSNSWGGGGYSQALKDAIIDANNNGIVFTAAAGNSGSNNDYSPHYPSNYDVPNIISVAAYNASDDLSSFSCYGPKTVHVAAPGQNILSSVPGNKYSVFSGTSMATPHVSGVVGLLLAHDSTLTPEQVRERLISTSVPGSAYDQQVVANGRVNAYNALTVTK